MDSFLVIENIIEVVYWREILNDNYGNKNVAGENNDGENNQAVKNKWIFGLCEKKDDDNVEVRVFSAQRDADTLLPIIQKHVN